MKAQLGLAFLGSVFLVVLCRPHQGQTVPAVPRVFPPLPTPRTERGFPPIKEPR